MIDVAIIFLTCLIFSFSEDPENNILDHVDDDDILADPGQKGESINTEQSDLATQSGSFKSLAFIRTSQTHSVLEPNFH